MENKFLLNLTGGIYMVSARHGGAVSGCIADACIMISKEPAQVVFFCMNRNYTCEIIKAGGSFTVNILDETCDYATICHFGYQSGRNIEKFNDMKILPDCAGNPYLLEKNCGYITCSVSDTVDLGTHTLFLGTVIESKRLNLNLPMTYADYELKMKPQKKAKGLFWNKNQKSPFGWKCNLCGYEYRSPKLLGRFECPICEHYRRKRTAAFWSWICKMDLYINKHITC